jgi:hypothetical protein
VLLYQNQTICTYAKSAVTNVGNVDQIGIEELGAIVNHHKIIAGSLIFIKR